MNLTTSTRQHVLEARAGASGSRRVGDEAVDRDRGGERRHDRDDREQRGAGREDRHLAEQRRVRGTQPAREDRLAGPPPVRPFAHELHQCQDPNRLVVIDTHCHLDTAAFDADRDDVLARAARGRRDRHARTRDPAAHLARAARARRRTADRCASRSASTRRSCPSSTPTRSRRDFADALARGGRGQRRGRGRRVRARRRDRRARARQEELFRAHIRAARALEQAARHPRAARARRRAADPARGARRRGRRRDAQLLGRRSTWCRSTATSAWRSRSPAR